MIPNIKPRFLTIAIDYPAYDGMKVHTFEETPWGETIEQKGVLTCQDGEWWIKHSDGILTLVCDPSEVYPL